MDIHLLRVAFQVSIHSIPREWNARKHKQEYHSVFHLVVLEKTIQPSPLSHKNTLIYSSWLVQRWFARQDFYTPP